MTTTTYPDRLTMALRFTDHDGEPITVLGTVAWDDEHDAWTATSVYADTGDAYGGTWSCADVDTVLAAWAWAVSDGDDDAVVTVDATPDGCPECGHPITDSGTGNPCATRYACRACGWDY